MKSLLLIFAILAVYLAYNQNEPTIENFQSYIQNPYNYIKTGADPLTFYSLPRYRKPYRFPFKFHKSYPYPHLSPYEN